MCSQGWSEFRVCDIATSGGVEATQECLDRILLADSTGKTRFDINGVGPYNYRLVLPSDLSCQHCMVQWKWHCGMFIFVVAQLLPLTFNKYIGC